MIRQLSTSVALGGRYLHRVGGFGSLYAYKSRAWSSGGGEPKMGELEKLRMEIAKLNDAYYNRSESLVSDYEYDMMLKKLEQVEIDQDVKMSSTVGAPLDSDTTVGKQRRHLVRMLSLNNTYSIDDLTAFEKRVESLAEGPVEFVAELKYDGIGASVIYEGGKLLRVVTRGDGEVGEDITEAALHYIPTLPRTIAHKDKVEVRGEVVLAKRLLGKINEWRQMNGDDQYKNTRNMVSGVLRASLEDSPVEFDLLAYQLIDHSSSGAGGNTYVSNTDFLRTLGFTCDNNAQLVGSLGSDAMAKFVDKWARDRTAFAYDIDGIVVKVNDLAIHAKVGAANRAPRWAVAYKFGAQARESTVLDVTLQVGRSGKVTPVAHIDPIDIGGALVSRATLNNIAFMERLGVAPGARVLVERAGDVIPKISTVCAPSPDPPAATTSHICPCGRKSVLVQPDGMIDHFCIDSLCPAQLQGKLAWFVSRDAMDVDGLGPQHMSTLISSGLVTDFGDLYALASRQPEMLQLDGFSNKRVSNLVKAIEKSKSRPLEALICGLGIPGIGRALCRTLAERFGGLDALASSSLADIETTGQMGPITSFAIYNYFHPSDPTEQTSVSNMLAKLKQHGANVVVTGKFDLGTREHVQSLVVSLGGTIQSSIRANTTHLFTGAKAASAKITKASSVNARILSESDLVPPRYRSNTTARSTHPTPGSNQQHNQHSSDHTHNHRINYITMNKILAFILVAFVVSFVMFANRDTQTNDRQNGWKSAASNKLEIDKTLIDDILPSDSNYAEPESVKTPVTDVSPPENPTPKPPVDQDFPLKNIAFKVMQILPFTGPKVTHIGSNQPIVVVYNRPVIPLGEISNYAPFSLTCKGSDVPIDGTYRWVTSSIVRFDVNGSWPSNLECTFSVDPATAAYDNTTLVTIPAPVVYVTGGATMHISSVSSPKTMELTENQWSPYTAARMRNGTRYTGPEVPPDAIVELSTSTDIDVNLLKGSLVVHKRGSNTPVPFTYTTCNHTKVCLSFGDSLQVGATYDMKMPAGTKFNPKDGPLPTELSTTFNGLYPFIFPWVDRQAEHNTQRLLLRHGLSFDVTDDMLKKIFTFVPATPFTISKLNPSTLEIKAVFSPNAKYYLKVDPQDMEIKDGWDLPLIKHQTNFTMAQGAKLELYKRGPLAFQTSNSVEQISTITQNLLDDNYNNNRHCPNPVTIVTYPVTKANLLDALNSKTRQQLLIKGMATKQTIAKDLKNTPNVAQYTTKDLWRQTNTYLEVRSSYYDYECRPYYNIEFISQTDVSISTFSFDDHLMFWATYLKDNTNVVNATISVYGYNSSNSYSETVYLLDKKTVTSDGTVTFPKHRRTAYVVLEYGLGKLYISNVDDYYYPHDASVRSELITDRKLYNAGEVIHLKGYLRGPAKSLSKQIYHVEVSWMVSSTLKEFSQKVDIDPVFNTFNLDIPVPAETNFGTYSVRVNGNSVSDVNSDSYYTSTDVFIADPRIPTGILTIAANDKFIVYRDDLMHATLTVSTSNYIGTPQNGQIVTIKASYESNFFNNNNEVGPMEMTVTTNDNGVANATFKFDSAVYHNGDKISFVAHYLDPTRALVTSEPISLYLIDNEYAFTTSHAPYMPTTAPNCPDAVFVDMIHVPTGKPVDNVEINLKLSHLESRKFQVAQKEIEDIDEADQADKKKKEKTKPPSTPNSPYFCTFTSSANTRSTPPCHFSTPDVGTYLIVARGLAPDNKTISSTFEVGQTQESWEINPFGRNMLQSITLYSDQSSYYAGDTAIITYLNPFKEGRAQLQYGCDKDRSTRQFDVSYGVQTLLVEVSEKCSLSGMFVNIVLLGGRLGFDLVPNLPVDPAFKQRAPFSATAAINLSIKTKPLLNLTVELADTIVSPKSNTSLTLKVRTIKTGELFTGSAEAAIFVIDKRNLDLMPYPLPTGDGLNGNNNPIYTTVRDSRGEIVDSYVTEFNILLRRIRADPWLSIGWGRTDISDRNFFKEIYNWLTESQGYNYHYYRGFGGGFGGGFDMEMGAMGGSTGTSGAMPMMASFTNSATLPAMADMAERGPPPAAPAPKQEEGGVTSKIRSDFQTTPLFVGKLPVEGGSAKVSFSLPDDLTTFEIRAFLITKESDFYAATSHITSRKEFNINPVAPRFARIGDIFEAGASITVTDPEADRSNLEISIGITTQTISPLMGLSRALTLGTGTTTDSLFSFTAIYKGNATLTFTLKRAGVVLDSVQVSFDVLGKQLPIYMGTSMAISANTTAEEGVRLPETEPGTGTLEIAVGVGRYPPIELLCIKLLDVTKDRTPSSVDLLSQQVTFGALSSYGYNATLVSRSQAALGEIVKGFSRYETYQAIAWYPDESSDDYYPTLYALILKNLMDKTNMDGWTIIKQNMSNWAEFVDAHLNTYVEDAHRNNYTVSKELIAYASIGLSYYWAPKRDDLAELYSWDALTANITDNCGVLCQTYFMMAALIRGENKLAFIPTVIQTIENNIRIQGRTAYVTYGPESSSSSLTITTYAALSFMLVGHETPFLEKMINFIATGGILPSFAYADIWIGGLSSEQMSISIITMNYYDKLSNSTHPNLSFIAFQDVITNQLLTHSFTTQNPESVSKTITFNNIASETGRLLFRANGTGEISAAIGITYVPLELPAKPVYRGFYVQKTLELVNPLANSTQPKNVFYVGQSVRVTISITTPDDIGGVYIEDSVSAGVEPLDNKIYNELEDVSLNYNSPGLRYWFFRPFSYRETHKDKVIYHGTNIQAGSYTVSYNAITAIRGTFTLPPTKVYSPKQPEVFGLSDGRTFSVQ
eukprot:gene7649-8951_t